MLEHLNPKAHASWEEHRANVANQAIFYTISLPSKLLSA